MINSYGGVTMDYQRHYNLLIEKAQQRTTDLYTERHHIVPRCLGGTDDKDNLVALTPEEHYVAHQLLVKMYPENASLVYAANKMTVSSKWAPRNNKLYGWLKRKYQSVCKQRVGAKNGSYGRRWYHDPVTLANGKFKEEEVPLGWELGRVPNRNTVCEVCGEDTKGKMSRFCEKHRKEHISKSKKGKTHSLETKKKISNKSSIHQRGSGNSQYGTMWIHSPEEKKSKKIKKDENIPEGWLLGRLSKI